MKSTAYIFLLLQLCTINLFSQDKDYSIVAFPLSDERLNNKLEQMELSVLYLNDDNLFSIVDSEKLQSLQLLGINYSVLSEFRKDDRLFLLSSKSDLDITSALISEEPLYNNREMAIVKNLSFDDIEDVKKLGFDMVELKAGRIFKNQKSIWKENRINLNDSLITQITSSVNPENVRYFIQSLQDFQTRFLLANTRDAVAAWIKDQFLQMGFTDVVIDSFDYAGTWQKNVIATLPGIYEPEVYNVVGGHHDSYSSGNPMIFAPGADDNASGTAAVLEIARVIKANNYQPESTIKFITFAAEEYGLFGSYDYALKAYTSNMNIKIMINHDMISHTYYPANQSKVDINRYSGFEYLRDLAFYCIQNYSLLVPVNGGVNSSGSDSYSFWERGFPAVYFEENDFSPFYHSPADTIGNYNMEYCSEVIKSSCATLLLNIGMPSSVENYYLVDAGTGNSLIAWWSPNQSPDLEGYKIYLGSQSGSYDTSFTTNDTLATIGNLIEGNLYYVGISVLDQDGYESLIVERSATPLELPAAPAEFTADPLWHQVQLSWLKNNEYDLLGYNIYRSDIEGELGDKLNQSIYLDTVYMDNSASNGIYYYYTVKTVDNLLNESIDNTTLRSRVVSMDQGILVVDETSDGDGSPMNPTDAEVDQFYNDILEHFNTDQYDIIEQGNKIGLADLGAYSTIIWHGNDMSNLSVTYEYREEIKKYLDFGGNCLYTGYKPSKAFENVSSLSKTFSNGDFIFDYFKIQETKSTIFALFNEAKSLIGGYANIFVDSVKTLSSNDFHLKDIEMTQASAEGVNIISYETNFDSTTQQGILKGKPVGVEYIGNDYKSVIISFPLYYMNKQQAKSFIQYVLTEKFDEVMPVEEPVSEFPAEYKLYQNFPNPFNPSTKIKFNVPVTLSEAEGSLVTLKVYDVLGNEIETIVNEEKLAGTYEVEFTAVDLPSGVYFYKLQTGSFIETKKMILLK
ncbi:MAG: M20/M25/M40 family metallo-hydrolase [Ignavibacteriaceae bacterium]